MKLVVDANVLFSALIREGATRRLWFRSQVELCAPAMIIVELIKYKKHISTKFSETESLESLTEKVLSRVRIVGEDSLKPFIPAAKTLIEDPKDWIYLACALKEDAAIWTNDRHFMQQKRVKIRTTTELLQEILSE